MWGWLLCRRSNGRTAAEQLRKAEARLREAHRDGASVDAKAKELSKLSAEELSDRIARAFGRRRIT